MQRVELSRIESSQMFTMKTVKLFLWLSVLVNVGYSRSVPVGRIDSGDVKGDLEGMGSRQKEEARGTDGDKGQEHGNWIDWLQPENNDGNDMEAKILKKMSEDHERDLENYLADKIEAIAREEERINPTLEEDRASAVSNLKQEMIRINLEQLKFKANGGELVVDDTVLERTREPFIPLYLRPPGNFTKIKRTTSKKTTTTTSTTTTTTTKPTTTVPTTTTSTTTTPTITTPTITTSTATTPTTTTPTTTPTTTAPTTATPTSTTPITTTSITTTPTTTPTTTTTPTITTPTTTTPTTTKPTSKGSRSRDNKDVAIAVDQSLSTASPNGEGDNGVPPA